MQRARCFKFTQALIADDEDVSGNFFNDFLQLDLEKFTWRQLELTGKKDLKAKRRRNKEDGCEEGELVRNLAGSCFIKRFFLSSR